MGFITIFDNMNMPLDRKKTWKTEGFTPQNMGKKTLKNEGFGVPMVCVTFFPSIEFASQIHPRIGDDGLFTEKTPTIPGTKPASFCLRKSMGWESFWDTSAYFSRGRTCGLVSGSVGVRWAKKHQWINGVVSTSQQRKPTQLYIDWCIDLEP